MWNKTRFLAFCVALVVLSGTGLAQPYGLNSRPVIGPFLNGKVPPVGPGVSGNWSAVKAFPNLIFTNALGITFVPGTTNMVVWEREGRVWMFANDPNTSTKWLVLDIHNQCQGWDDSGLLNLVFHPGFATNRYMFVYYTWVTPGTVVGDPNTRPPTFVTGKYHDRLVRYTLDAGGVANAASETSFIDQTGNSVWHNGSGMFFHPVNGFLYYTDGDDEDGQNEQRIDHNLFAGTFRIDVDRRGGSISHAPPRQPDNGVTANYFVPNDNPFVGQANVLEEFFALGLRSPHRMTIDPPTGRIFIGDVGAGTWEEINIIEPTDPFGLNFQWDRIEGPGADLTQPYIGVNRRPALAYDHSEGQAVIGGNVYHGARFATDLGGKYIFGDNVQKKVWWLDESVQPPKKVLLCLMPSGGGPNSGSDYTGLSSFGLDANNELYFCQMSSIGGFIYTLSRSGPPPNTNDFPALLSQTGAFANTANLQADPGLIPYDVNTPLWSDGAIKTRWMAVPTNTAIAYSPTGEWTFPAGSVFVKNFELNVDETQPAVHRRLETRLLVRDTNGYVFGATYKWRPDNSDADLLPASLTESILVTNTTGIRTQNWYYPSRSDCLSCHTQPAKGVLGVKTRQSNRDFPYPAATDNQLRTWNHVGLFSTPLNEAGIPALYKLVSITNSAVDAETRVRSYLDANCSQCHRPGGAQALWDARFDTPLAQQGIVNGPVLVSLGLSGMKVVTGGDTNHSMLFYRDNRVGPNQMPPLAKNMIDTQAMAVLAEWINTLPPPPLDLPPPWQHQDIGNVGTVGAASYAGGVLTISASGDDIWNNADAFHMVYQQFNGNGEIFCRVAGVQNTDAWAKEGVMIRESLDAGSRHAFVCVTPGNGVAFQRRTTPSGASDHTAGPAVTAPYWVRLTRTNTTFTAWSSPTGANWVSFGTATIAMSNSVFWGVALTAHNNGAVNTSTADNLGGSIAPFNWPPFVAVTSPANNATFLNGTNILLSASASDEGPVTNVDFYANSVLVGRVRNSPFSITWSNVAAGAYALTARASDSTGLMATSAVVNISVIASNTAPSVVLTSPADNSYFISPAHVTMIAFAMDDGGITNVDFFANGSKVGTRINLPYQIIWTNSTPAAYTLTARATDNTGLIATSGPVHVIIEASNTPPTVTLTTPSNNSTSAAPAQFTLTANPGDIDGVVTNVSFFVGALKIGERAAFPYTLVWSNVPQGVYALSAVATDDLGASASSGTVTVTVILPPSVFTNVLIAQGSVWKYLDNGSDQGTGWRAPAFNDNGWAQGPAPLGYGDANGIFPATTNSWGPDENNKYVTTYYRRSFAASNTTSITGLVVNLQRDDGAIVYLNDVEVFRSNMPGDPINYLTNATLVIGTVDEVTFYPTNVNPAVLLSGTNVAAVEVHQATATSSDIIMDLSLVATGVRSSAQTIVLNNPLLTMGDFTFWFNANIGQKTVIEVSTQLSIWTPIWTNTAASTHIDFMDQNPGGTRRFYRARMAQ